MGVKPPTQNTDNYSHLRHCTYTI